MPNFPRLFAVIAFSSFFAATSFAGEVRDPHGILDQLDSQLAKRSFDDAFKVGDRALVRIFSARCAYQCEEFGCMSGCETINRDFEKTVTETGSDSAVCTFADGTTEEYSPIEFATYNGNWLRKELSQLDLFIGIAGPTVVEEMTPTDFVLADQSKIAAFTVKGEFIANGAPISFEYAVAKDAFGSAQILFKKIMLDKIFKVKALSRP